MSRLPGFILAALLGGCRCDCPPPCPDLPARDLAAPADLSLPADLSRAPDLSCIRCDAVLNPCPALGLYCDPVARCCSSTPH